MRFTVLTLFPEIFSAPTGPLRASVLRRAQENRLFTVDLVQIRDFANDRHRCVDDAPYGGGPGMVLRADVLEKALASVHSPGHVIYLSPQGRKFQQDMAVRLARLPHVVLVCGRYEGVDERFVESCVDEEISLGDFVLAGGEVPALAVMEAVVRLLPGVVGKQQSVEEDSFCSGLLDYPHYTRPLLWNDQLVPEVLLSGDHGAIAEWRRRAALSRTADRRPDLLDALSEQERALLNLES